MKNICKKKAKLPPLAIIEDPNIFIFFCKSIDTVPFRTDSGTAFLYPYRSLYRVRLYHLNTGFSRKRPGLKPFEKMLTQGFLPVSLLKKIQGKEAL